MSKFSFFGTTMDPVKNFHVMNRIIEQQRKGIYYASVDLTFLENRPYL